MWNDFLLNSRSNTFLPSRNFMDYHKDRFEDYSLIAFENGKIQAILPANITPEREVHSHGGLTYGGIYVERNANSKNVLNIIMAFMQFLDDKKIEKFIFKQLPSFYQDISSDEIDYAFFLMNANMFRVDIAYAVDQTLHNSVPFQERRKRAIKKAFKNGVIIKESNSFENFWNKILTPNLLSRFGVQPVHSLDEINSLNIKNPGSIKQFEAWLGDEILAGTTIFETSQVAHAQYISATEEGRKSGAIDLLFNELIQEKYKDKKIFDFGIVNENGGRKINQGLLDWKEGFGARAFSHRFYHINPAEYKKIEEALS